MKLEFIIFSMTGHTRTVAEDARNKLLESGHDCCLTFLEPKVKLDLRAEIVDIKHVPELMDCDVAVICTPVHGGKISAPVRSFLTQVGSLVGIRIVLLVTHFFRQGWGAIQTLRELGKLCEDKGGEVVGEMNIKWFSIRRKQEIMKSIDHLSSLVDEL